MTLPADLVPIAAGAASLAGCRAVLRHRFANRPRREQHRHRKENMKIIAAPLDAEAVTVAAHTDPPRIVVRLGAFRLTLDEPESVHLASAIVDAIAELRADQTTNRPHNR